MSKRFKYYFPSQVIKDKKTGQRYYGNKTLSELLNKLSEENERLKSENSNLHQKLFEQRTRNALERTEISKQPYKTSKEFLKDLEKW